MSDKLVISDLLDSSSSVADELALRHLVLDVRTRQVNREHQQREADDVDRVWSKKQESPSNNWRFVAIIILFLFVPN